VPQAAHALLVADVARQAQVVAQAWHALKKVLRELRVEQAHQLQIVGNLPAGLVVEADAGKAQCLAAGLHQTAAVGLGDQGALLGYCQGPSVFFSSAFSLCSRPMAAYRGPTSGTAATGVGASAKTWAACWRNGSLQRVVWVTVGW
jgi:hypothetical protein